MSANIFLKFHISGIITHSPDWSTPDSKAPDIRIRIFSIQFGEENISHLK